MNQLLGSEGALTFAPLLNTRHSLRLCVLCASVVSLPLVLLQRLAQQAQRRHGERLHVPPPIGLAGLDARRELDRTGDSQRRVTGGIAIAVASRPSRAGFGDSSGSF